jgi:hypothetical protein
LLAPKTVEFFSQDWKRIGDQISLKRQIHEITGIPDSALQGARLSSFSDYERFSWIERRHTKVAEDKAYALLGIFDVTMTLIYGEGVESAFRRLREEIDKLKRCLQDLRLTNPHDDKKRIEDTKGGLLKDSYYWILENRDFHKWRHEQLSKLLWIKGDPGKGKTMLLCGIINEMNGSISSTNLLAYFFCQATDSRINNATAILRGLLYILVSQQPSLISYIQKKHDFAGKALFEDANAWVALSEIFTDILQCLSLNTTYLFIDALDECVEDLDKLLAFIVQKSSVFPHVKWILTSRNDTNIEQRLRLDNSGTRLSLELKENAAQVSRAVEAYINCRLLELEQIRYDPQLQLSIREIIQQKANGTFLWVSLVMKELKDTMAWDILQVLGETPTELKDVYQRMLRHINGLKRHYPGLCRQVLSTIITTYRPLHLQELYVLLDLPNQVQDVSLTTATIVNMCGSFLTIRDKNVYVVHQSARDFLLNEGSSSAFPSGIENVHNSILFRSIQVMSRTLKRDIYSLGALGCPIEEVEQPNPDPLVAARYSCTYWIDHLCNWNFGTSKHHRGVLQDKDAVESFARVESFLRKNYLYWLESLSLCKSMSKGVVSMAKLETSTNVIPTPLVPSYATYTNSDRTLRPYLY